jgi:hypothetical protein
MPESVDLPARKKTLGLATGLASGVAGGTAGAFLAVTIFESLLGAERTLAATGSDSYSALEIALLIAGLAIGFGVGLLAWAWLSTRLGWLTWEEIEALLIHRR